MADLTSSSTIAEVCAAYDDNCLYDIDGSTTKARLFIQACRILLRRRPEMTSTDGLSAKYPTSVIETELRRAQAYMAANSAASRRQSVRVADTSRIRDF